MVKYIPIFLLSFMILTCKVIKGQISPSSCTAHDSIIAKYKTDAQKLALTRIYYSNSNYKDSAIIPMQWSDSILRGLLAVYNCSLLERDTIIKQHNIHAILGWDMFELNDIIMYVDTSEQWVKDILIHKLPNSNTVVNTLLNKYHFTNFNLAGIRLTLFSDSNYNMNVVAKEWVGISGVYGTPSSHNVWVGDGSYILADSMTSSFLILTYSYGWGDCPAGCTCRRFWQFKIHDNCDVELLKTWEYTSPNCYLSIPKSNLTITTLSPNPCTTYLNINSKEKYQKYKIFNIQGVLIKSGALDTTEVINTQSLYTGLYIVQLISQEKIETIKIQKE